MDSTVGNSRPRARKSLAQHAPHANHASGVIVASDAHHTAVCRNVGRITWKFDAEQRSSVMLVLSRGRNDKVVFPTLGISVEILRVAGNKVRLGIDAPHEVPVHRHEISERMEANGEIDTLKFPESKEALERKLTHATRNRLNAAALGPPLTPSQYRNRRPVGRRVDHLQNLQRTQSHRNRARRPPKAKATRDQTGKWFRRSNCITAH